MSPPVAAFVLGVGVTLLLLAGFIWFCRLAETWDDPAPVQHAPTLEDELDDLIASR